MITLKFELPPNMVNIENLLKNSVILTNWIYLVPVLLFSLGIIKFLESKNQPRLKPEKKIKKKLSEEEYIGGQFLFFKKFD